MSNVPRDALALLAGLVVGGVVNMAIVTVSPAIIAPPAGVDVSDVESLKQSMHLFEPRHFVMPFLAHALGTFTGALVAFLLAATSRATLAHVVGAFFLLGGIAASVMIPAPTWFIVLDLVAAYVPMAWLGSRIASRIKGG